MTTLHKCIYLKAEPKEVWAWLSGARHVPARHDHGVFRLLQSFEPVS